MCYYNEVEWLICVRKLRVYIIIDSDNDLAPEQDFRAHHNDFIMGAMASQTPSLTIVYTTVYSGADQRKHQSSASLAFVRGIHR